MSNKPQVLHFGAGNIGRGFIAPLLAESGYHVVFADVDPTIINHLNSCVSYNVHILDTGKSQPPIAISDVSAVHSVNDFDKVLSYLASPQVRLVTTAVGPNILKRIAPALAKGLRARREANAGLLNVIACENMVGQTDHLAHHIFQHLSADEQAWAKQNIGFANCSVDRIVPPADQLAGRHPLDVGVESFYEWVVDETGLKMEIDPRVKGMKLTKDLNGYIERKLYTLNCGHAITAYYGSIHSYPTIDQAIRDPDIRNIVRGALMEGGAALVQKHNFSPSEHEQYIEKILSRFENPMLKDEVTRVGRQPLRKLGRADRLLGPAHMAREYGLPIDNLARGIAAAFLYRSHDDEQSVELQGMVREKGIGKTVVEVAGFSEGSPEHGQVLQAYHELSRRTKL